MKRVIQPGDRGVALVTVLACLVIITVLMVVFLTSVRTELAISKSSADAGSLKPLADTCANIVISQIQSATQEAASQSFAWASQPGMIRVFDNGNGGLTNAYKLYSSDRMVVPEVDLDSEASLLEKWDQQPSIFTDLNMPRQGLYPIMNPGAAAGGNAVEGFFVDLPPGNGGNAAAMPGRWIYILQDGALVAPAAGTEGGTALVAGATEQNPITGRIAFWTDDETCKVNINTASEGTYWDVPRFQGTEEANLANYQPFQKEYQRYPGHPAMVSLSSVFPWLTRDQIYAMVPRVVGGGSDGGTVKATRTPLTPDSDRLYATVGEFIFANNRSQNAVDKDELERRRFFLTATSRAPELNLFGMPRVSIWPVHADLAATPGSLYATAYDRVSAFCSTFGGKSNPKRYYFQRKNANSPTEDYADIPRNRDLFNYLKTLTAKNIPGFGGSFSEKYGDCKDQILAEIYDYIRCVNLVDENLTSPIYRLPGAPASPSVDIPPQTSLTNPPVYQFTVPYFAGSDGYITGWAGSGQVAPMTIPQGAINLKGFGRFNTISEVALHLICCADGNGVSPDTDGSANDPRTVSNLATARKLKDGSGQLVGMDYTSGGADFPRNETLGNTYNPAQALAPLLPGQKRVQAALLVEIFTPSQGSAYLSPEMKIAVDGLQNIEIGGVRPFPLSANGTQSFRSDTWIDDTMPWGGITGFRALGSYAKYKTDNNGSRESRWLNPPTSLANHFNRYLWISNPFTVNEGPDGTLSLAGNPDEDIIIKMYVGPTTATASYTDVSTSENLLAQSIKVRFPAATIPTPDLMRYGIKDQDLGVSKWWEYNSRIYWSKRGPGYMGGTAEQGAGCVIRVDPNAIKGASSVWRLDEANASEWDISQGWSGRSDVVRSLVPKEGDSRLIAGLKDVPSDLWVPHPDYHKSGVKLAHSLCSGGSSDKTPGMVDKGPGMSPVGKIIAGADYPVSRLPDIPPGVTSAEASGDWDNGFSFSVDGAYINKPDDGSILYNGKEQKTSNIDQYPLTGTPNRIIPSAGMFGSLPTGINPRNPSQSVPWQTLLFRPQPSHAQSKQARPGQPSDHLLMDLFTMSVVEPYAISEPFSTSGKVNMNYQIMPYTYIHRSTALQAALKAEKMVAVPTGAAPDYKTNANFPSVRFALNVDAKDQGSTLRQFEARFGGGDIFHSASEICDIYLVPKGQSWKTDAAAAAYWNNHKLTGDNARERPYANLYARLTTRSNSYQVFYRVQTLKKIKGTGAAQWSEDRDRIAAEQSGSFVLERYLEPGDETLSDAAASNTPVSLDNRYKFRILGKRIMNF